jgi:beta-galactosidase
MDEVCLNRHSELIPMKTRLTLLIAVLAVSQLPAQAARRTVSLNGIWEIDESTDPDQIPRSFGHRVPVPGLIHLAEPAFEDAGTFQTAEWIASQVRQKLLPASALVNTRGVSGQTRNFFWLQALFTVPEPRQVALLRIGKAQFGTVVWLNGKKVGEHRACFTAGFFDLSGAIDWRGENRLVVRLGAHPATLPDTVPSGTDPSKKLWLPGIYDDVSLILADNPVIESVQVAPRVRTSEVEVETRLRNYGRATSGHLRQQLRAGAVSSLQIELKEGESKVLRQTLRVPAAILWTPEKPFIYELATSAGGDEVSTRFGMRELRFDTATRRAYLNGQPYFFRGSNIALHRFFEDPRCGRLPWDEKWVRRVVGEIPKQLGWNSLRFHVGPPPDLWLDMADQLGIIAFNEYYIFGFRDEWSTAQLTEEFREWMRDQWNHPSVVMWDASNETRTDRLVDVIRAVRKDDLSNRAWDNGYSLPEGPDDPIEDHEYFFLRSRGNFNMADLEAMTGAKSPFAPHPTAHAAILNEYDWLWLQRNGNPTQGTQEVWSKLVPAGAGPAERIALRAYLMGGLTEYWRAFRNFAGVLHFAYLSYSVPYSNSSDCFTDIENLVLEPQFKEHIREAFNPVGVYLNFWQPTLAAGADARFAVMMVNDTTESARGNLILSLSSEGGGELARQESSFDVPALGQQTYSLNLKIPEAGGKCLLKAAAYPAGGGVPTLSRRHVTLAPQR